MFDNTDDLLAMVQAALGETADADAVSVSADGMIEGTFTDLSAEAPAAAAEVADSADEEEIDVDSLLAELDDLMAELGIDGEGEAVEDTAPVVEEPAVEAPVADADGVDDALLAALDGLLGGDSTPADEGDNGDGDSDVGENADGVADDLLAQMRGLLGE